MPTVTIPTFDQMMNPVIEALRNLGGSGTIEEIGAQVSRIMDLSDEQLAVIHDPERGSQTEVEYRLAWTRTYLKKYGVLENSSRGVWALTPDGARRERVDPREVRRAVQEQRKHEDTETSAYDVGEEVAESWRDDLFRALLSMDPSAFERLFQRVLRESGFVQVEVTGRTGDGGIDGHGIMRIGGLISFRVLFQCKRWKGSVGASVVRDFRGAMVGRADKGLLVTTGTFTREAELEATRDGAPAIDLIDGENLMDKLKELGVGVKTELVEIERVTVDHERLSGF